MPAWIFWGKKDNIVLPVCSEQIVKFLEKMLSPLCKTPPRQRMTVEFLESLEEDTPDTFRLTAYPDVGHACWNKAYKTKGLLRWLLQHSQPFLLD